MKEFNLELAKAGHPVQTRDGRPARIICYDRKNIMFPIIALIKYDDREYTQYFDNDGKCWQGANREFDLVMASTKKEGWVNVYKDDNGLFVAGAIFDSEYKCEINIIEEYKYVATTKIEFEE